MRAQIAAVVGTVSIIACGNEANPPAAPTPQATQVTTSHITIDGVDTVVELQAVQLAVTAHRSDGSMPDVTARATWATSDPRIATVAAGLVTGENHGTATITAEYDGKSRGHEVTVTRRPPMQCFVDPVTDTPWEIEKSVGPPDGRWRAVRVTYRLLNDCASRARTSRFRVQVWDNPERIGQRISTGATQDIGAVDFAPESRETISLDVFLVDGFTWEDVTPEAVLMSWQTSYPD